MQICLQFFQVIFFPAKLISFENVGYLDTIDFDKMLVTIFHSKTDVMLKNIYANCVVGIFELSILRMYLILQIASS